MRLYLVRHPPPSIAPGTCYGRSDVPCAPADLAATLGALLPQLPTDLSQLTIYSSPLRRCADLARALPGATVLFDARLMEMDFGAWEMQRWDAIPRNEVDAWATDLLDYRPGGGESVHLMAQRVVAFYQEIVARKNAQAVVICHAGSMRLLAGCAPGLSVEQIAIAAASTPHRFAFGEVLVLARGR